MSWIIEVAYRTLEEDPSNHLLKESIEKLGIKGVREIRQINTYYIEGKLTRRRVEEFTKLFIDPATQICSVSSQTLLTSRLLKDVEDGWLVEVKPKVETDLVSLNTLAILESLGFHEAERVKTSTKYIIIGKLSWKQVEEICRKLLVNEAFEEFKIIKI